MPSTPIPEVGPAPATGRFDVSVAVALRDEERHVKRLLDALLDQTLPPAEIVLVDDGSRDATVSRIRDRSGTDPRIRCLEQPAKGPAAARNLAWRACRSPLCAFTDGDCVPDRDWLERLCRPFGVAAIGAAAGTYRTMNDQHLLARFVGHEIDWRYRDAGATVDCHGTYNLAVRRSILEEVGGFDESYRFPSGEDFDLTYRIAARHAIAFVPDAVVGHDHPTRLLPYLTSQMRRARDRVRLYFDHPDKLSADTYTRASEKYQVLAAGVLLACSAFGWTAPQPALALAGALLAILFAATMPATLWIARRSPSAALYGIFVRVLRNLAWALGVLFGGLDLVTRRGRRRSARPEH